MAVKVEPGSLRVLVADDDKATCLLLKTSLVKWGYHVVVAEDGDAAWEIISGPVAPHLLIIDRNMPGQDGYTICTRIRKELAAYYNPYIIILTQSGGQENMIKGLDAGANEFVSKPFSPAELQSRVAVGEKIVRYEDALKEQNRQLKAYISQIETASSLVVNATASLGDAMKGVGVPGQQTETHLDHLKKAHSAMDDIIDVFKNFDPSKSDKKPE